VIRIVVSYSMYRMYECVVSQWDQPGSKVKVGLILIYRLAISKR
jgi:hypothetical protein